MTFQNTLVINGKAQIIKDFVIANAHASVQVAKAFNPSLNYREAFKKALAEEWEQARKEVEAIESENFEMPTYEEAPEIASPSDCVKPWSYYQSEEYKQLKAKYQIAI